MHPRVVASAVGAVVSAAGAAMLIPAIFALLTSEGTAAAFFIPAGAALISGGALFYFTRKRTTYTSIRDVFLIVVLGWIGVATVGSAPYWISGLMTPLDAFFESMAGFTTTGASTVLVPEDVAPSLLLWRSLSQWTGGIGIVLLFVAVGPLVGLGAGQLFTAEMANPIPERITPRIRDTAKILAYVYAGLTLGGIITLSLLGMSIFDAVNHALTTVSTGGYSTRTDSIAAFDSLAIEVAVVVGMLLSGASFALYFRLSQGRVPQVARNVELRAYLGIFATSAVIITLALYASGYASPLTAAREAVFQSASLLTGTAFSTAQWSGWDPLSTSLLMVMMAIGGSAGSTTGGIKVVRAVLLVKHAGQDIFRMLHPRAVTPLRLGDRVISERFRASFLGFFFIYIVTLIAGTLALSASGVPAAEAFNAVFACQNLTGTALGPVGDAAFYAALPAAAKVTLTLSMLLGRLELFTVLVLFSPEFWRR